MSFMSKLAGMYIEVSAKGVTEAGAEIDKLKGKLNDFSKLFPALSQLAEIYTKDVNVAFQKASVTLGALKSVLLPATGVLAGFVRQGLALSAEGQIMTLRMQRLSFEIASIFTPTIRAVLDYLQKAVNWFRGLTGEQQKSIRVWALTVVAITGAVVLLPMVIAGVKALGVAFAGLGGILAILTAHPLVLLATGLALVVIATVGLKGVTTGLVNVFKEMKDNLGEVFSAVRALGGVLTWLGDLPGIRHIIAFLTKMKEGWGARDFNSWKLTGDLFRPMTSRMEQAGAPHTASMTQFLATAMTAPFIGAFATALNAVGLNPTKWLGGKEEDDKGQDRLGLAVGGFESLDQTWKRIAASSRLVGGETDPQKRTVELLEEVNTKLAGIKFAADNYRPVVR